MSEKKAYNGRVIFDHLPKTAGTSFNRYLKECLGFSCVSPLVIMSHRLLIKKYGGEFSIINGHIEFDYDDKLDPRYEYITCVREPIDRIVSWLYYILSISENESWNLKYENQQALNVVKKLLNGDDIELAELQSWGVTNYYVNHFCKIGGFLTQSDDEKLENAIAAIKKYNIVGLYEDMPDFITQVNQLLELPNNGGLPSLNVTSKRPAINEIDPKLRNRLIELNKLDLIFYDRIVSWKLSDRNENNKKNLSVNIVNNEEKWQKYEVNQCNKKVITSDLIIKKVNIREGDRIKHNQKITFDLDFSLCRKVKNLEIGIHIFDHEKNWIFGINSILLDHVYENVSQGDYRLTYRLSAQLPKGRYTAGFAFVEKLPKGQNDLAWYDVLCEFLVYHDIKQQYAGYLYLPTRINLKRINNWKTPKYFCKKVLKHAFMALRWLVNRFFYHENRPSID